MSPRPSLRLFAAGVLAVVVALAVVGWTFLDDDPEAAPAVEQPQEWAFVTEPDLSAPYIDVSRYAVDGATPADDQLVFLAPKDGDSMTGPLIVNGEGLPVWIGPDERAYDLRVQQYEGEPVLTWWRGDTVTPYYGAGEFVLVDSSYEEVATVTTHGVMRADYHEMTLTDEGTALLIGHRLVRRDLTDRGGSRRSWVADGIVQEVDVATGEVLFEWSALEHIPISQAMVGLRAYGSGDSRTDPYDFAHLNSVTEDGDDAFLISARNTSAVYRVDRDTGAVQWTLGGKASDFTMAGDSEFYWQHDAQRQADGTITLFDNEAAPPKAKRSRGLRLTLDMATLTARVATEYLPPDRRLSGSQGNLQVMPNGHVFVGWGSRHYYSEYTADGELLLDGDFGTGESYRSYRFPWVGRPAEPPTLTLADGTAYVSWNGATEVAAWRFLAGADAASARDVGTIRREGFETSAEIPDEPYIAVQALDADGTVLTTVEH
jgi:Arylsulfotransferase (ASST)